MNGEIVITGDGSPTVRDGATGALFHSRHGALAESEHVFINAGLLYAAKIFGNNLTVLEAGFGTGLNAALTLLAARTHHLRVQYTGIEKFPLDGEILAAYRAALDKTTAKAHDEITSVPWNQKTELDAILIEKKNADFGEWRTPAKFNVIYFDLFAPSVLPGLWTGEIFRRLAGMLHPAGVLVTFCAQGEMRRQLKSAGFEVGKLPGAPGKREMTRAVKTQQV